MDIQNLLTNVAAQITGGEVVSSELVRGIR